MESRRWWDENKREVVGVTIASLFFALLFCWPIVERLREPTLGDDWDQHLVFHWVPYQTVAKWKQVPLWNPYLCGGTPMLGNPQSRILTPFFLLHLVFGPLVAIRLEIILHLALLFAGSYVLSRVLGLGKLAATASALVSGGCSAYFLHVGVGHSWTLCYAYAPWVLAAVVVAIDRQRLALAALAGLGLALMANEGGIYPAPHSGVFVAIVCVGLAIGRKSLWPLKVLAVTAVFGALFATAKLLPTWELMREHPRVTTPEDYTSPELVQLALFSLDQDKNRAISAQPGHWGWHEYGAYVGLIAFAFAALGALLTRKRAAVWSVATLVLVALSVGLIPEHEKLSAWWFVHKLPPFSSLHVPSRFLVLVAVSLAVLAGFGVQQLSARRRGRFACVVLLFLSSAVAWSNGPPNLKYVFAKPNETMAASPTFQQFFDHERRDQRMLAVARSNRGLLNCYDYSHLDTAAVASNHPTYKGEQYIVGEGEVHLTRWSPNVLEYDVNVPGPATLVVNQNFHAPWRLTEGAGTVASRAGLISVQLPAGSQHIVLEYVSRGFRIGVFMALLGLAGVIFLFRREKRLLRG